MKTIKIESIGQEPIILNVPEGAKVSIEDGLTIVAPEFNHGDILFKKYNDGGEYIFILDYIDKKGRIYYMAYINKYNDLKIKNDFGIGRVNDELTKIVCHATDKQKQIIFDALAKENKAWDAEKKEIVDLKYIPKVGDCVKAQSTSSPVLFQVKSIEGNRFHNYTAIKDGEIMFRYKYWDICAKTVFTKITPEELQSEFNKLGYEYDFETHTAKKLRWKPKDGGLYWLVDDDGEITNDRYDCNCAIDINRYNFGNCFKTEDEAQKFKDYILKYNPE